MENKKHYFVNIIDNDLIKIGNFCKMVEEKYDRDTLTGISFAHTNDGNFLLGLSLIHEPSQKEILESAKQFNFKNTHTKEEDWIGLINLSTICIIGNFNYRMILKGKEK
jgi:hypothetical protein